MSTAILFIYLRQSYSLIKFQDETNLILRKDCKKKKWINNILIVLYFEQFSTKRDAGWVNWEKELQSFYCPIAI